VDVLDRDAAFAKQGEARPAAVSPSTTTPIVTDTNFAELSDDTESGSPTAKPKKVLFLDMDDTLYRNNWETERALTEGISRYVLEEFGLTPEETYGLYKKYGTTIGGLQQTGHKVNLDHYLETVHNIADLSEQVSENPELRKTLEKLAVPTWVFTSSIESFAHRVLKCLGIHDLMTRRPIIDAYAVGLRTKYETETYEKALEIASENIGYAIHPADIIFVDDKVKNLKAAKKAGWGICILVGRVGKDGVERETSNDAVDHIIEKVEELPKIFPELFQSPSVFTVDKRENDRSISAALSTLCCPCVY